MYLKFKSVECLAVTGLIFFSHGFPPTKDVRNDPHEISIPSLGAMQYLIKLRLENGHLQNVVNFTEIQIFKCYIFRCSVAI